MSNAIDAIVQHMKTVKTPAPKARQRAEILKEVRPRVADEDLRHVHGVTFDGSLVWFACDQGLVAFDPDREDVVRRLAVPASAGTAFDGENLYQIAGAEILVIAPEDGRVLRKLPTPAGGSQDSGMAYADGHLWVGEYRGKKIHQVDAKTGRVVKTLTSDRFVTGVSCHDGALFHGVSDDGAGEQPPEIRRISKTDGAVEEAYELPEGTHLAGLEATNETDFWCGGEKGTLRLVRTSRTRRDQ
jgi:hypothetical protein